MLFFTLSGGGQTNVRVYSTSRGEAARDAGNGRRARPGGGRRRRLRRLRRGRPGRPCRCHVHLPAVFRVQNLLQRHSVATMWPKACHGTCLSRLIRERCRFAKLSSQIVALTPASDLSDELARFQDTPLLHGLCHTWRGPPLQMSLSLISLFPPRPSMWHTSASGLQWATQVSHRVCHIRNVFRGA